MDEAQVPVHEIPATDIDAVKGLWLTLAALHWQVAAGLTALAAPVTPEVSWAVRREQYTAWSTDPGWLLLGARTEGRLTGYLASRITPSASSWDFGEQVGRLETLAISTEARGRESAVCWSSGCGNTGGPPACAPRRCP